MDRDICVMHDPSQDRTDRGRRAIAVIGIDHCRTLPPLTNAVNDALGALHLFQSLGFEQVTEPLLDEAATAAAMNRLVSDELVKLDADDSLVLFFAGHGTTTVRRFSDGMTVKTGYIVPSDASSGKVASLVKLEAWLDDIARLPAKHILVILDACHSGIALSPLIKWRSQMPSNSLFDHLRRRRSRRIITSALDDQLAMDNGPVVGHSLFTGCLIEALTGGLSMDGRTMTTGSELGVHLRHRVMTYPQSQQMPDFGALALDDRGEMLIPLLNDGTLAAVMPLMAVGRDLGSRY